MDINQINVANLAYIGDSVYEVNIRYFLVTKHGLKIDELQTMSKKFVSAVSQSKLIDYLMDNNFLTDDEQLLINRARNYKPKSKPKHVLIKDYKKATSLEALFGALYINNDLNRIKALIKIIIDKVENK